VHHESIDTSESSGMSDSSGTSGAPARAVSRRAAVANRIGLRLDAGPDACRTITVDDRPLVLGRAGGAGHIADPLLEAHHLLVDPARQTVVQLAGRASARVDGNPIGGGAALTLGSVIEVGASRIVVTVPSTVDDPHRLGAGRAEGRAHLLLGLGVPDDRSDETLVVDSFVEQARRDRDRSPAPITIDLRVIRRVLVVGPPAEQLVHVLAGRIADRRVTVTDAPDALTARVRRHHVVLAHVPDPEAEWPGELPCDAAVVGLGATWQATVMRRSPDGSTSIQRFHASGDRSVVDPPRPPRLRPCARSAVVVGPRPRPASGAVCVGSV
jgi:hypothetical protein